MVDAKRSPLVMGVDVSDGWETTCKALHYPDGTVEILAIDRRFIGEAEPYERRKDGVW